MPYYAINAIYFPVCLVMLGFGHAVASCQKWQQHRQQLEGNKVVTVPRLLSHPGCILI